VTKFLPLDAKLMLTEKVAERATVEKFTVGLLVGVGKTEELEVCRQYLTKHISLTAVIQGCIIKISCGAPQ
jgi:hypothetical protein